MTGPSAPTALAASGVSVDLGGRRVVHDVSFDLAPGRTLGLIGPNGSGKSTLLRAVLGLLPVATGEVRVEGRSLSTYRLRELARVVAAVLQDETGDIDIDAREVVAMGRGAHKRLLERDDGRDREVVDASLEAVGVTHLAHRRIASMSGGERQRVLVARALAQEPRVLVMDEPTNHLDVRHQFEVLALARARGLTAVVALHDLNLAAHYCDELLVLESGQVAGRGSPTDVLDPALLGEVYGVDSEVGRDDVTGSPHVRFRPPR
jgi:iron complex transport system ATP-binding protein